MTRNIGNSSNNNNNHKMGGWNDNDSEYDYNNDSDSDEDEDENSHNMRGGKKDSEMRHFKIVEVNGKEVEMDSRVQISKSATPLNAAKKLLGAYCRAMNIASKNRPNLNLTYKIKETTRGSKRSVFGPYKGTFTKYTPEEMKKAKAAGQQFTMKAVVKIVKDKKEQKGGNLLLASSDSDNNMLYDKEMKSGGSKSKKTKKGGNVQEEDMMTQHMGIKNMDTPYMDSKHMGNVHSGGKKSGKSQKK